MLATTAVGLGGIRRKRRPIRCRPGTTARPNRRSPHFVARVTTQGGPDFVPVDQRIATFDNDGTLWIEQPMYVQLAFILDRVKALAPQNPDWKDKQPFQGGARRGHEGPGRLRREGAC